MTFETIFQPLDAAQDQSKVMARSGNPGYQTGRPLVVARFNATGGDGQYQSLQVFPTDDRSRRTILFGQDSFQVLKVASNIAAAANRTEWCSSQWRSFVLSSFWGHDVSSWRLGVYGNAQLNDSTHWLALQQPSSSNLPCLSQSIRAELIVLYVRSGSYDQPQNKLLNAVLDLKEDGTGSTCPAAGDQQCSFQLTQSVVFIQADVATTTILPQPPRWRVQLPRDFFYPFLLSSSPSNLVLFPHFSLVIIAIVSVLYGQFQ